MPPHRQRSSDCTVLTATGLVNGEGQILTPYRIETPNKPIDKKFCTRNYDRFSKFFYRQTQQETCNKEIIKDSTTPQMCRYALPCEI